MPHGNLPWTRSCFVCGEANPHGLRLRSRVEPDGAVALDYTARPADAGWRHIVHGGILATLLDEVMTWAAILAVRRACVSAEITTRMRHPVPVGAALRVTGRVTRPGPRLLLTAAEARDDQDRVVAEATGKYCPMPAHHLALCEKDFVAAPDTLPPADLLGLTPS